MVGNSLMTKFEIFSHYITTIAFIIMAIMACIIVVIFSPIILPIWFIDEICKASKRYDIKKDCKNGD